MKFSWNPFSDRPYTSLGPRPIGVHHMANQPGGGLGPATSAGSGNTLFSGLGRDLRYTVRVLRKAPGFSTVALLTIAIGIAANTAIFSVINSLFLHPPGVADSARLMAVRVKYDKLNLKNISISLTDFAEVRDSKQVFKICERN